MKQYGVAIIGYGGMGGYHHKDLLQVDRLKVIGAYDINPERNRIAEKKGTYAYSSKEELLADKKVDIVIVATPNNFHMDLCIQAMEAGKHVLCEKPVAMSSEELIKMVEKAKECKVVFSIHQNRRLNLDFLIVKEAIEKNMIGKPFSIESRVHGARGIPVGWRQYKVAGGGMMLDWGVHLIDQILYMLPHRVNSVYAQIHNIKYSEADDYFKLLLTFENGITAQVEVGTCNFMELPRWYVAGDQGTIIVKDWSCENKVIRAKQVEMDWAEDIVYTKAGPTRTMAPRPKETTEEFSLPEPQVDQLYLYNNLIEHIEGKADLFVKPEEALRVMQVMEAAFESGKTGEAIKVNI